MGHLGTGRKCLLGCRRLAASDGVLFGCRLAACFFACMFVARWLPDGCVLAGCVLAVRRPGWRTTGMLAGWPAGGTGCAGKQAGRRAGRLTTDRLSGWCAFVPACDMQVLAAEQPARSSFTGAGSAGVEAGSPRAFFERKVFATVVTQCRPLDWYDIVYTDDIIEPVFIQRDCTAPGHFFYNHHVR